VQGSPPPAAAQASVEFDPNSHFFVIVVPARQSFDISFPSLGSTDYRLRFALKPILSF
jgi:hypothetical protein